MKSQYVYTIENMDAPESFQMKILLTDLVLVAKSSAIADWPGCLKCVTD